MPRRIRYQVPYRGIWADLDGSLTGLAANSWAVAYAKHNEFANECILDTNVFDGHICKPTVQVRRIAFHGMPTTFKGTAMHFRQYDDSMTSNLDATSLAAFNKDASAYSEFFMRQKKDP